jgi:beta-galactosidase GanA
MYKDKFLFGYSFAPYGKCQDQPIEEWPQDLENMKNLNCTVLRVFAPWDRIERREGEFDFSRQDRLFEIAKQKGLKVILCIGGVFDNFCGIYPPQWLDKNYNVQWPMANPSSPKPIGIRKYVCLNDPIIREKASKFLKKTINRYNQNDELISWQVWNEPYLRKTCYCPHCIKKFQDYLFELYNGNIDELNRRWSTEFPVDYQKWEEVEAPSGKGFLYGGSAPWFEWTRFQDKTLYGAVAEIDSLTKKYDPRKRPTTLNMCARHTGVKVLDQNINLAKMGKSVDVLAYSFYSIGLESHDNLSHQKAYRLSRIRSASQAPRGDFWVLETEVGPCWNYQTPDDIRALNYWQAIGHGAKALLGWNYRSRMSDSQVSGFHLNAWDGSITERAEFNGEFSGQLQQNAEALNSTYSKKEAAVLCLEDSLLQNASTSTRNIYDNNSSAPDSEAMEPLHKSREGAFKMLWEMNIATDFITEENLNSLKEYKLLLVPYQVDMSSKLAAALRDYVKDGGTIIAEAPFAYKNEYNMLEEKAPGYGLDEVFGASTNDMMAGSVAPQIKLNDNTVNVGNIYQYFTLSGAKVVAKYTNGENAIVANNFGKGRTLLVGTDVFRQFMTKPENSMTEFLQEQILNAGITPNGKVISNGKISYTSGIEIRRMNSENGFIYIIINHEKEKFTGGIELPDTGVMQSLQNNEYYDSMKNISLAPNNVMAFEISTQ